MASTDRPRPWEMAGGEDGGRDEDRVGEYHAVWDSPPEAAAVNVVGLLEGSRRAPQ